MPVKTLCIKGKTVVDRAAAAGCRPDEWLLVEAWDDS